jgi:hypothetical protein
VTTIAPDMTVSDTLAVILTAATDADEGQDVILTTRGAERHAKVSRVGAMYVYIDGNERRAFDTINGRRCCPTCLQYTTISMSIRPAEAPRG